MEEFASEKTLGETISDTRPPPASASRLAAKAAATARGTDTPKRSLPVLNLLIGFAVLALCVFVFAARPEIGKKLITTIDIFGISEEHQMEERRIRMIMQLRLVHEKKLALIDRKIFVGATPDMVTLSLGKPQKVEHGTAQSSGDEIWIYQIEGDPYSTVIEFTGGQLTKASQGSVIPTVSRQ